MYIAMLAKEDQEKIVQSLRGPQFVRGTHGGLHDRGSADSYYRREPNPHHGGVGEASGPRVAVSDPASVAEYLAGYEHNERYGDKKDYC